MTPPARNAMVPESANPGEHAARVGLAGWSYPDWRGVVYPAERPRGFSELRYIAERFDCVEVNCTFYRHVSPAMTAGWARIVEDIPGFTFTVKANRELTHNDDVRTEALRAHCRQLADSVGPLLEAGRLGGILLQFPWYFEDSAPHRERLDSLAAGLSPLPLFVEVRHHSFLDASPGGALPFLESRSLNLVNIDLPRSSTSPRLSSINTGRFGYFRLHGRNWKTWFDPKAGRDDKYDYLYSRRELEEVLPYIERVLARTRATYVITNNHFRGQAAVNAIQIAALLGQRPKPIPEGLHREFPFLAASTATGSAGAR